MKNDTVLDPFCGSGTTNIVCLQRGIQSIGVEISPLMAWVSRCKTRNWDYETLKSLIAELRLPSPSRCSSQEAYLSPFADFLRKAFAPEIVNQLWTYARTVAKSDLPEEAKEFVRMGLVSIMEETSRIRKHGSHYRYLYKETSVGLRKLNIQMIDPKTDIRPLLLRRLQDMLEDIANARMPVPRPQTRILEGDFRETELPVNSVDAVITSPPYLNRNNYIAQQKAELALLSLVEDRTAYRTLSRSTLRSHVEANLPSGEALSCRPNVAKLLEALELSSANNPKIPAMIAGYFEDMQTIVAKINEVLKPGGTAAFVVGNSRWGGVIVPVDHLLMEIAEEQGFTPQSILVTRMKGNSPQQMRKYGRIPVRESIVIFSKPE